MLQLLYLMLVLLSGATFSHDIVKLPILALVPYPDPTNSSGWDKGLELLPAARVAVEQVNNDTSILNGYELELIEQASDPCGVLSPSNSIINWSKYSLNRNSHDNAIAVIGLACSTITAAVSPISGHPEIDLLQVSMATSPIFNNAHKFRRLWRVLPSSLALVSTAIAFVDQFNWTKLGVVHNGNGINFLATSMELVDMIESDKNKKVIINVAIDDSDLFVDNALERIKDNGVRIILVTATEDEIARLLCRAVQMDLIWPGYQWIIFEASLDDIINASKSCCCSNELLAKALENIILLRFGFLTTDRVLVSGQSYREYRSLYQKELDYLIATDSRYDDVSISYNNSYADAMYDEVWALSLAINSSLSDLELHNLSLSSYQFNQSRITNILEDHFSRVSFEGAASNVSFHNSSESLTPINIYHVHNLNPEWIGSYNPELDELNLFNVARSDFPTDEFTVIRMQLPLWITIVLSSLLFVAFFTVTLKLILYICYYKVPEIRATSPSLTMLIFLGSYMILGSLLLVIVQPYIDNEASFSAICIAQGALAVTGLGMLIATGLVRLIRIYHIFTHFGRTGKAWRDGYLFLYILLISMIPALETILVIIFDRNQHCIKSEIDIHRIPPIEIETVLCQSDLQIVWEVFRSFYILSLLLLLIVFAFLTRKINRKQFKDTKKFIIFAFVLLTAVLVSYSVIYLVLADSKYIDIGAFLLGLLYLEITVIAQFFFIDTKVFPALFKYTCRKSKPPSILSSAIVKHSVFIF